MTTTDTTSPAYTGPTESMQTDPAARASAAAASFPAHARCASYFPAQLEWVPSRELREVPQEMAALCRRCPVREQCLRWAVAHGEHGYWAGTTSLQRAQLRRAGRDDVSAADELLAAERLELADGALHDPGLGGIRWYRRGGCRCGECRRANAAARAAERAAARARTAA